MKNQIIEYSEAYFYLYCKPNNHKKARHCLYAFKAGVLKQQQQQQQLEQQQKTTTTTTTTTKDRNKTLDINSKRMQPKPNNPVAHTQTAIKNKTTNPT